MKYMCTWSVKEENFNAAIERFTQNPPAVPEGVTMVERWHQMGSGDGFTLFETEDAVALSRYILAWADLVDQQIYAVVDEEEIGQALSQM